jgi:hypothetical protein
MRSINLDTVLLAIVVEDFFPSFHEFAATTHTIIDKYIGPKIKKFYIPPSSLV